MNVTGITQNITRKNTPISTSSERMRLVAYTHHGAESNYYVHFTRIRKQTHASTNRQKHHSLLRGDNQQRRMRCTRTTAQHDLIDG